MEITGKVLLIETNATIKGQKGNYTGTELTYKDSEGITKSKAFHSNALKFNAALNNGLNNLAPGDEFTAVLEKKDEFWNWISVSKGAAAPKTSSNNAPSASAKAAPSTYATAEERAKTQKQIVRQSSLANALKLLELNGNKKATTEEAINIAEQFEAWVLGNVPDTTADIANMDDDIPY